MSNIDKLINSLESAVKHIEQIRNNTEPKDIDRDRAGDSKSQKEYEKYLDGLASQLKEAIVNLKKLVESNENKPVQIENIRGKGRI
ncbi:MAG: hypothetical protein K2X50_03370 [Gammaproteobacteria bacterium]|nr:hypothetical protein [Gammaproteobacteria bacterium]